MKTVVLAGGEGTRLRPLTLTRPKPMLPLGPTPVIEHLIKHLTNIGFNEIILTIGYMGEQVKRYLGDGSRFNARIHYSFEPEDYLVGTAGSVKMVSHLLQQRFLVIQGDTYTEVDLSKVVKAHIESGCDATIMVKSVENPWLFGTVEYDEKGIITGFQEKPEPERCRTNKISTGVYVFEPDVLDFITQPPCDFARNVFPKMLASRKKMLAYECEGYWVDVGSRQGYIEAQAHLLKKHMREYNEPIWRLGEAELSKDARLEPPVLIGCDVRIEADATIGPYTCIMSASRVSSGSTISSATLFENVTVGSGSNISHSIIGERAILRERVVVKDSIVGQAALLKNGVNIYSESRIWPNVIVEEGEQVKGTILFTQEKPFYFFLDYGKYTGIIASSIPTFIEALTIVDIKSIEFHLYRRDFERWIRDVIQAPLLAEEIASVRKQMLAGEEVRAALLKVVKAWFRYVTEGSETSSCSRG
ncbi:MAG: sugar phosphate nucleotidyltransferase [Nitrososphaerales archaeon]